MVSIIMSAAAVVAAILILAFIGYISIWVVSDIPTPRKAILVLIGGTIGWFLFFGGLKYIGYDHEYLVISLPDTIATVIQLFPFTIMVARAIKAFQA